MSDTPREPFSLPARVALVVAALFPLVVLRLKLSPLDDADAYWHILSGQEVWQDHVFAGPDSLSRFTGRPWVKLDWLTDVAMAAAHHVGGFAAVSWLFAVAGVAVFVSLWVLCRDRAGVLVATLVAVAAWIGTTASQSQRPQTISFILLAVTLTVWLRVARDPARRPPWWLVPLSWVWASCHGLWFMGPMVGVVVVVGMALDRTHPLSRLVAFAAVPVLEVVAAGLTPVGPQLLTQPFVVSGYAPLITEWQSPDIHEPYVAVTLGLIGLAALGWARATDRVHWVDVLLWGVALVWAVLYARTVALGAVVVAPVAAAALQGVVGAAREAVGRLERLVVVAGAVGAVILATAIAPVVAPRPVGMPTGLGSAVDALPRGTVVFNAEAVGGWLMLEHPGVETVVDTRNHLFAMDYVHRYVAARAAGPGWQETVASTGARAALLPSDSPLAQALPSALGWRVVAESGGYVLLSATG